MQMVQYMKVSGIMINEMVMEKSLMQMEQYMKVNG